MAPQHDEIVKILDDGFAMAWDTTEIDAATRAAVDKVVEERVTELGEIFGVDIVVTSGDTTLIFEAKGQERATPRRGAKTKQRT